MRRPGPPVLVVAATAIAVAFVPAFGGLADGLVAAGFILLWLLTMLWMTGALGRDRAPTGPTEVDGVFWELVAQLEPGRSVHGGTPSAED